LQNACFTEALYNLISKLSVLTVNILHVYYASAKNGQCAVEALCF